MSVTLMDYRDTTGFYGYRVYMSKKPFYCIQKYFSFRKNGTIVSKTVQKAIYQEALAFEADIRAQHEIVSRGSVFIKIRKQCRISQREVMSPSRISGLNFNLSSVRPEYNVNIDWLAVGKGKHYDISFNSYKPYISLWRGTHSGKSAQFRFGNKHEYFNQYKAAIAKYDEMYDVTAEELDLMYEYQPPWHEVRDFVLAEAIRVYGIKPLGLSKICIEHT